jgi:U4/U6.U5 tri-snRNP-associated protein 2
MGLNNIKANDYVNVVVQAIMRCKRFRDFFLFPAHYQTCTHPLVLRTGELARKLWCTDNYKSHISPHELLQAVVNTSQKRFQITKQSEAVDFLVWYLNTLSQQLSRKKNTPDIVAECFQGKMVMSSRRMGSKELLNDAVEQEKAQAAEDAHEVFDTKLEKIPFLYLTLDVPPPPLYVDIEKDDIIPQVPLLDLFRKFDGVTEQKKGSLAHTYKITKIPRYLILYIKRFTKNNFFTEKNPTIVKFPIKNLDLEDYYSVGDGEPARYDLLANVVHTGKPSLLGDKTAAPSEGGRYKVQILHKATGSWYEIEDLHISEVSPQAISISEAYLQIYELVHT